MSLTHNTHTPSLSLALSLLISLPTQVMQVSVVLKKVGLATQTVANSLDRVHADAFTAEQLTALKRIVADASLLEIARMQQKKNASSASSDCDDGSVEENFLQAIASVVHVEQKLEALIAVKEAPNLVPDFQNQLSALALAVELVMGGEAMRVVCVIVLQLGNFLNAGANTFAAQGFSLGSLMSLSSMKAADGTLSLLDVVLKYVLYSNYQHYPPDVDPVTAPHPCTLGTSH